VSQKSEPPKQLATATTNLHRFKWNFTYTTRHLFLSSTPNFIKIPYSVYEIFNFFKLLSQISVTDTTYFLADVICDFFTFQQDSAPAHCACATVSWDIPTSTAHLIGHRTVQISIRWTNSIWDILQERIYRCQICDVDHLKEWLIEEWRHFDFWSEHYW